MTTTQSTPHEAMAGGESVRGDAAPTAWPKGLIVDMSSIDLSQKVVSKRDLERYIPHRGQMVLIDGVVWHSPDFTQGVAVHHVRDDEFWVPGHFPGRPLMPGVLQIEASAQIAVFLFNARQTVPMTAAFTRIENCSFRSTVEPGSNLYLLAKEIKINRRGFISHCQGICNGKLTFEAEIHGLNI